MPNPRTATDIHPNATFYTAADLLRVAKRQNNPKRSWLLINPLQAKHLPVSPTAALAMMHRLGDRLAARCRNAGLLIAFAETATAIGGMAAAALGRNCVYLTTTRERFASGEWLEFHEEHSHAVSHLLSCDRLAAWIRRTDWVVLVDDELSTGTTVLNMVRRMRERVPELAGKRVLAASILNRMAEERLTAFKQAGIDSEWLLRLSAADGEDYERRVAGLTTVEALPPPVGPGLDNDSAVWRRILLDAPLPNPRLGLAAGDCFARCDRLNRRILRLLDVDLAQARRILCLGTEECMLPALLLGRDIEAAFPQARVFCHATTRSPIGVAEAEGYPIRAGYSLPSLYEADRRTFLYNLDRYDLALVLTDAPSPREEALRALAAALRAHGCDNLVFLRARRGRGHANPML